MFNIKAFQSIERNPDDSLPRMTPGQRQAAVRLIRSICCNHDGGNCLLLDDSCVQGISQSVICRFFRHVLLNDKAGLSLKAELFRDTSIKLCTVCGTAFSSASGNAKYCRKCAPAVQRRQKAHYARMKRRPDVEK
jgi:hypothetical protein